MFDRTLNARLYHSLLDLTIHSFSNSVRWYWRNVGCEDFVLFVEKKKVQNCPNDLIYITTMEQQTCLDEMKDVQFFQRCVLVDMTSRRGTTKNQRWNNVVYFNVGIYSLEQCQINVAYFNVDVRNGRQRWNNVVFFNVEFHNVGQRQNNVVKMTISKGTKTKNHFKLNELNSKFLVLFHNLLHFTPNF